MPKVLLVDDELTMVQMVADLLRQEGHEVFPFTNGQAAAAALSTHAPELVITDLYFDKTRPHGLEILKKARELVPPAVVIVITGFGSVETAKEAMKNGAFDYLQKPFKVDEFKLCVQRALSYNAALTETVYLRKQLKKKYQFSQIIGSSASMQGVFKMIERVADTDSTILVLGESGTGKELVARALHFNSRRQLAPFVPINCSALPENLLESELFGHRRGAFTGAITDKKGLFQEADGGTIFLDEVGSMPPLLQSRLLRVLQEREVRRVGDNTPVYVNVRVVAAANESLEKKIKDGTFREDLYYRLNVIPIQLPGLRERKDDIPLLVAHFLKDKISLRTNRSYQLTRQAMAILCGYNWPGNVRELENAIERAATLAETEVIQAADLPPSLVAASNPTAPPETVETPDALPTVPESALYPLRGPETEAGELEAEQISVHSFLPLKTFMREQEQAHLNRALEQSGGDKEKAALLLGISLATLYRKLSGEDKEA
ncbi:MAG TPA: sigma-54 dependent transcriptional regulator [Candidatus Limnocylindrales bacterium]|jgi:DNA-binding NtrC family response regulator|nr:sigma-54 dependent transcriptional regulator [Candidatus Limnocylindrales bacterium]